MGRAADERAIPLRAIDLVYEGTGLKDIISHLQPVSPGQHPTSFILGIEGRQNNCAVSSAPTSDFQDGKGVASSPGRDGGSFASPAPAETLHALSWNRCYACIRLVLAIEAMELWT